LLVTYNTSVIDTLVIYVGSGAAAASNVTEALIIREILDDSSFESGGVKLLRSLPFSPNQYIALDWNVF
jgi:hypothetical protein